MTKVPFDYDLLIKERVIVHVPLKAMVSELEAMLYESTWYGETMEDIWDVHKESTCYRIDNGKLVNRGDIECYQSRLYENYLFMEFEGVSDLPEVEDLI